MLLRKTWVADGYACIEEVEGELPFGVVDELLPA